MDQKANSTGAPLRSDVSSSAGKNKGIREISAQIATEVPLAELLDVQSDWNSEALGKKAGACYIAIAEDGTRSLAIARGPSRTDPWDFQQNISSGFWNYNDTATATVPISITSASQATPLKLTNNALGSFTNESNAPSGMGSVWDSSLNEFDLSAFDYRDTIFFRLNILVTTATANQLVKVNLRLAVGGFSYLISFGEYQFKAAGAHRIDVTNMIFGGDDNTLTNPAYFEISSDGNADVEVRSFMVHTSHHL